MKRKLILTIFSVAFLASCGGGGNGGGNNGGGNNGGGNGGGNSQRVSFKTVYDELLEQSTLAKYALTLGTDYSYLSFDSNPSNVKGGTTSYIEICHSCTIKCGFSEGTWQLMLQTRALDGTQNDSANGVNARWTYHPDSGLVCTFTYAS